MDLRDVSIPEPQDGELLIRVHPTRDFAFPFVTGLDGAGVVERTCSDNYSIEKSERRFE
jgi:NADPH:quinone reductase-like Zn-dependent oxidoreductase